MKNTYQFSNICNYLIFLKSNFLHNINKNIFFIILFLVSINPFFQISNAQSEKMVFEGVYIDKPVFIQNEQINSNSKNTIDTSSQKLIRTSNSISTLINFDEQTAPCVFGTQTLPGNTYIQRGLTFSGTWKVLNSCSNFVVSNFSQPNFLAWNTALTSRVESLLFTTPVKDVSFGMASNSGVTLNIKLFNEANEIIENRNTPIFSTLTYISFTTNNISKIEISVGNTGSSVGILDNLNFARQCPIDNLTLFSPNDDYHNGNSLKKAQTIFASNSIQGNTTNVVYLAEKSIILTTGFRIESGSVFKAEIGSCY